MSRESEPFIGPTWLQQLVGWTLLLLGGLLSVLLVGLVVAAVAFDLLVETDARAGLLMAVFWASLSGMAAVAGWRILRSRPIKDKGPRGWMWLALGSLGMIPLFWGLSRLFLGVGPIEESTAYVTLGWWILFLLTFPALRRFESSRRSPIRWWEWGVVQGLLTGSAAGLQIYLSGRGPWFGLVGGLVNGAAFFVLVGGSFLWREKVGRTGEEERSEPKHRFPRSILVIGILGAAIAGALSAFVLPWARDRIDPLWRVRKAFDEIVVPGDWQEVHYEEVDERFLTPWGGAAPGGQRTYLARERPRTACQTSSNILAEWSQRHVERVRVKPFPNIHYRCRSYVERDGAYVTFTVWDRGGWRSDEFRPSVGRYPVGDRMLVIELKVIA